MKHSSYLCTVRLHIKLCKGMKTNVYTSKERLSIANTIWRQLGSQGFSLVTGCKPIVYGEDDGKVYLLMSVGSNRHAINRFEVSYNEGMDLYEVKFMRRRGEATSVVADYKEVYFDMLHTIFEQETGLVASIRGMYA